MSYLDHAYTRIWEAAIECMTQPSGLGDEPDWPDRGDHRVIMGLAEYVSDLPLVGLVNIWLTPGVRGFAYAPDLADKLGIDVRLGTPAASGWFHELAHWADFRANESQVDWDGHNGEEVVAELVAATLLLLYGFDVDWHSTAMRIFIGGNTDPNNVLSIPKLMDRSLDRSANVLVYLLGERSSN